jgi:hypothetical protein
MAVDAGQSEYTMRLGLDRVYGHQGPGDTTCQGNKVLKSDIESLIPKETWFRVTPASINYRIDWQ